jgi:hypothetical protein
MRNDASEYGQQQIFKHRRIVISLKCMNDDTRSYKIEHNVIYAFNPVPGDKLYLSSEKSQSDQYKQYGNLSADYRETL